MRVLVTGATGVVGSTLVPFLAAESGIDRIFLVVRARDSQHLQTRKDEMMNYWGAQVSAEVANKILFLPGDICLPQLGLSDIDYARVQEGLTHIVHSAANVKLDLPLEEMLKETLDATRSILMLQRKVHGAKLEYISTVGVHGRRSGALVEERLSPGHSFHNTYEESKFHSEQLIYQAQDEGLRITLHRPSMVIGNSKTGQIIHFQIFYFLLRLLSGRLTKGFLPRLSHVKLDTIPSDFVARLILWSIKNRSSDGQILHHSTGPTKSPSLGLLQNLVRDEMKSQGRALPSIFLLPHAFFRGLWLLQFLPGLPGAWKTRFNLFPQLLDYALAQQNFDSSRTQKLVAAEMPQWPEASNYLSASIKYFVSKMRQ